MNIGLVAHDSKKELIVNFCIAYKGILKKHELYATGSTGQILVDNTGLKIHKLLPGHLGGAKQLASQIECNQIDALIFLRDPIGPESREPDYANLLKLCDMNNIPSATNLSTAELVIMAVGRGDLDWREAYK